MLRPAHTQTEAEFMPKGGRELLLQIIQDPTDLSEIVTSQKSEQDWKAALAPWTDRLGEKELLTLTAYLAVNMPLDGPTIAAAEKQGDLRAALPPDGGELAWTNCQFCHSLFSSYLTQQRDVPGWLGMFQSPFHQELKMSSKERETFARYSAINMPMAVEDVPEDLRF